MAAVYFPKQKLQEAEAAKSSSFKFLTQISLESLKRDNVTEQRLRL
jgi:hypothetical protein